MDVKDAIETRRAYRSFDPIEITDELIKDFSRVAQIAPSCSNSQPWNFIFVYDKDQLKKLHETLTEHNDWVKKASMMIGVFSKPKLDCIIKDRKYYLFDTGLASAFIILRATELGLIAHPIAGFNEKKAKEILAIPEDMQLITFINIGKHSSEINPVLTKNMQLGEKGRPPRKDTDSFVYINKFA
ncbi:MAG: nitroreductase family protein [Candidatus Lokiarchaeota archaeon]